MTETEQTATRDIDVIHEFTDLDEFTKAVEGAVLLKLDFDIATEIRKEGRFWLVTVHGGING